jgi:hypothetical protein
MLAQQVTKRAEKCFCTNLFVIIKGRMVTPQLNLFNCSEEMEMIPVINSMEDYSL